MEKNDSMLLDFLGLTEQQKGAAAERVKNVVVTAGAGSGKTRTLVARYLRYLCEGGLPRQVVAITFTEKAAREMRSRIRDSLHRLVQNAAAQESRNFYADLERQMDSARIGTIHSLCAEILRSHPSEAGLDPQFAVVEENAAAVLYARAINNAMEWAIQQPELVTLFQYFNLYRLEALLSLFLRKRLDITEDSFSPAALEKNIRRGLGVFFQDDIIIDCMGELSLAQADGELLSDAGEALAAQIGDMLLVLNDAKEALAQGEPYRASQLLYDARRSKMGLRCGRKASSAKETLRALRERYDLLLQPWLGGAKSTDMAPDPDADRLLSELSPLLEKLYRQALLIYRAALDERSGLDFDDLEVGTVALMQNSSIRAHWQSEVSAVLVDEFQDTNHRQREIILALAGDRPGRLFVVGDARQSIYRFRGADVTVFKELQAEMQLKNGRCIDLKRTFRAHPGLLSGISALLAPIMGTEPDSKRPYYVPFAELQPERNEPRNGVGGPFVECIVAAEEDIEQARASAANALADRLAALKSQGEITSWDEVALLFRASTSFPIYEKALQKYQIPYLTIAGSGFYNRPEVRDLLNILRALADPWDDQALAGLLRSPAFGVSDVGLYLLRQMKTDAGDILPLYEALRSHQDVLSSGDRNYAQRALLLVNELLPLVDRLPVGTLLKRVVDRSDYCATLATCAHLPDSARLWQNVDKLVDDARNSGEIRVRAFLEYVAAMRDVGARESEANAGGEGVVRLMTIHKSKGLEFPFLVLADANRRSHRGKDIACQMEGAWTYGIDKAEKTTLAYRLARHQDSLQSEAEELRLLYVAMTRAKEKLIINGHLTSKDEQLKADGWLRAILDAGGISLDTLQDSAGNWNETALPQGAKWGVLLALPKADGSAPESVSTPEWPESEEAPLYPSLISPVDDRTGPYERPCVSLESVTPPAVVVGSMVHKALQLWLFPGDARFERIMQSQAMSAGLIDKTPLQQAVRETKSLLQRFQNSALYKEMDSAEERRHEVPYITPTNEGKAGWGFMDCLYKTPSGWTLVDFKTDELADQAAVEEAVARYKPQLLRYRRAAAALLNQAPRSILCFMNSNRAVEVCEIK